MPHSTVTTKGQATIPLQVRKLLNIKPSDKVFFRISKGKVLLEAKKKDPMSLFGKYRHKSKKKVTVEQMNKAILEEASKSLK
jgi:AbrB family looped-hinge helix DNA binding protein